MTEVNVHEGDMKIEFLHPHGPRKTFSWPFVADKCFVPVTNVLCVITASNNNHWANVSEFRD